MDVLAGGRFAGDKVPEKCSGLPEPTQFELLTEAISVRSLTEAEALRRKFMRQRGAGVKAWKRFLVSVEVFEKAMKQWQGDGAVPDEPES